ncbi:MAG TPA: hypothetical protein VK666_27500 [Chryseolinea sp.]|nr:hypothetical protein [Chryseolinea sp.]
MRNFIKTIVQGSGISSLCAYLKNPNIIIVSAPGNITHMRCCYA